MLERTPKHRILILGGSGFLGESLYKELCQYFKTYATYFTEHSRHVKNKHFIHYDMGIDELHPILKTLRPTIIISAIRGPFIQQVYAHECLVDYTQHHNCRIIFLSSANVFDAYSKFPSFENDKTLSNSIYGHFKIKIETMLMRMPVEKWVITRLPMVFGMQSPKIINLKEHLKNDIPIEVFPNLIMNITTDKNLTQQIHYIINQDLHGIFHLGSKDLVHHDYFYKDLLTAVHHPRGKIKYVYTTNDERYLAVLPKDNKLPDHLYMTAQEFLEDFEIQ